MALCGVTGPGPPGAPAVPLLEPSAERGGEERSGPGASQAWGAGAVPGDRNGPPEEAWAGRQGSKGLRLVPRTVELSE